jgi:RHS repeat-associated protein
LLPDGNRITFDYDPMGQITAALSPSREIRYVRDALGRVIREEQGDHVLESHYDAVGRRIRFETSLNHKADYLYDAKGRVHKLAINGKYEFKSQRDSGARETVRIVPGGMRIEQRFDLLGRLIDQRVLAQNSNCDVSSPNTPSTLPADKLLIQRSYHYNQIGALVVVHDSHWGKTSYSYNSADQLVEVSRNKDRSEKFTYGDTGNVIQFENRLGRTELSYDSGDRLTQCGDIRYYYDRNGRLVNKVECVEAGNPRTWQFTWNASNQLLNVRTPNGEVWSYDYDAFGRRIRKKGPGGTVEFVWDNDVVVHEIEDEMRHSTLVFETDSFKPICMLQSGELFSVIVDHLGTPRELVTPSRQVSRNVEYEAWGQALDHSENGFRCPIRFPGQWFDKESGLHYNRFRYYDPNARRFISQDPIRLLGGTNLYRYARNPINWADPYGLQDECPLRELAEERRDERVDELLDEGQTPSAVVGAYDPETGEVVVGVSGNIPDYDDVHPDLRPIVDEMGGLGAITEDAVGPVGNCAEFDAANQLLHSGSTLEDIEFTDAVRPRTGQQVPMCDNCQNMFGEG